MSAELADVVYHLRGRVEKLEETVKELQEMVDFLMSDEADA